MYWTTWGMLMLLVATATMKVRVTAVARSDGVVAPESDEVIALVAMPPDRGTGQSQGSVRLSAVRHWIHVPRATTEGRVTEGVVNPGGGR